jgi:hypothetical protein
MRLARFLVEAVLLGKQSPNQLDSRLCLASVTVPTVKAADAIQTFDSAAEELPADGSLPQ